VNTEDLGNSKILNLLFKPAGMLMGSRVRGWLMNPVKTLQGAGIQRGLSVLEVGCTVVIVWMLNVVTATPTASMIVGMNGYYGESSDRQ